MRCIFLESDLGLHCLLRPVPPNTFGKYGSPMASQCHDTSFKFYLPLFVCGKVLRPSQPNGVMSSAVSLPNHTFTGQA